MDKNNCDWLRSFDTSEQWIICGDFNSHSPLWDKNCYNVINTCFSENVIDSDLILLNDGRVTRIPDVSTHFPSAIDLTLTTPDLAVDCVWNVESDSPGSDHLPITIPLHNNVDIQIEDDTVPKYIYSRADWEMYQSDAQVARTPDIDRLVF